MTTLALHTAVQITAKNFGNPHGIVTAYFDDTYQVMYWPGNSGDALYRGFHRDDLVPLVPEAENWSPVSFSPEAIDQHFEDDSTFAALIWAELDEEQRHDAALTAMNFFENDDQTWAGFHDNLVNGIAVYHSEQIVGGDAS